MHFQNALPPDAATAAVGNQPEQLVTASAVAIELCVTRRTVGRWLLDLNLVFPHPVEINKRLYFRRAELEAWKSARLRKSIGRQGKIGTIATGAV